MQLTSETQAIVTRHVLDFVDTEGAFRLPVSKAYSHADIIMLSNALSPYQIEVAADNSIVIMSPVNTHFSPLNSYLIASLFSWAAQDGSGIAFESSAGWALPDGSIRMADAAWVSKTRWRARQPKTGFAKIAPDFAVELRSPTDRLTDGGDRDLIAKMQLWIANGVKLGWLIDPIEEKAYVFEPNKSAIIVDSFDSSLDGKLVLPGFTLLLSPLRLLEE